MAKSVLIVDDVPFVRKTIASILTDAHYQIAGEATNGKEALEMFVRLQPDIVTMDIVMPVMGGIEATRQIVKRFKEARVVIVSALNQEHVVMEAINAGASDFVMKPFRTSDILKAIDHALYSDDKISERAKRFDSGPKI